MINLLNEPLGFRLHCLEVYNWGTFDQNIWIITPNGATSVLTGANGSGKSTLVDALLTLLVPNQSRNYNLASGTQRRERSEKSYVQGLFSRTLSEENQNIQVNSLRGPQDYTVLLAVFKSEASNKTVTIAQRLWFQNNSIEKRYYVSSHELSIDRYFAEPKNEVVKKNLARTDTEIFSQFNEYFVALRKRLGIKSSKALDLFNQTVSVKEIPSLNHFVRQHMLEDKQAEMRDQVTTLLQHYDDLNIAYHAIIKARQQLEWLIPLPSAISDYERASEQIKLHEYALEILPYFVADKKETLLRQAIEVSSKELEVCELDLDGIRQNLEQLREDLQSIRSAIDNDNIGQQISQLQKQLPNLREIRDARRTQADKYNQKAKQVDLKPYGTSSDFQSNFQQIEHELSTVEANRQQLDEEKGQQLTQQQELRRQIKDIEQELQHLQENNHQIPLEMAKLRQKISLALGIPMDEMPFVGELLRVSETAEEWEGVLERLLHNFALELLIDALHYEAVSEYLNKTRLGGKLVYQCIQPNQPFEGVPDFTTDFAYTKLEVKDDTLYSTWIKQALIQRFDYHCCWNLKDFRQYDRAVTQEGQVKHSASQHEKDDYRTLGDRRSYVLGWDNQEKKAEYQRLLATLIGHLEDLESDVKRIQKSLEAEENISFVLRSLKDFEDYNSLDWRSTQQEIDRLEKELAELNRQSGHLDVLKKQKETLSNQIRSVEQEQKKRQEESGQARSSIDNFESQLSQVQETLKQISSQLENKWEETQELFAPYHQGILNLNQLDQLDLTIRQNLSRSLNTYRGNLTRASNGLMDIMTKFINKYPEDSFDLSSNVESYLDFEQVYQKLHDEDLPSYENRFQDLLKRRINEHIVSFQQHLELESETIKNSIHSLNESLSRVEYNMGTYINLKAERSSDAEISEFRRELRSCIQDVGYQYSLEDNEHIFERIRKLISRFENDTNWMQKVLDVRRWWNFAAEELRFEDHKQVEYYTDSSGKSGGQKAKLAYTILASAIAYQYGLQEAQNHQQNTFRLVVIDEAFSKLDDYNARYAMQLFEKLGLQLMVVTPMDKIHVIEPYAKSYHFTHSSDEGNLSSVANLTIAQFQQKRRELQLSEGSV